LEKIEQTPMSETNPEKLPIMRRIIASAVVISSDGYVLMGLKNPKDGGVYADVWHIPGGGVEPDESFEDAMRRELLQEAPGIDLENATVEQLGGVGSGATTKVVDGQRVWCEMEFHRFRVRLPQDVATLSQLVRPGDDLEKLHWFAPEELASAKQIPGGREFFQKIGLIQKSTDEPSV
jgi:8-oxo-dGTP pyrophosphatase MutT (NUDIX family)